MSEQMVTCVLKINGFEERFLCSFVYALNEARDRRTLWSEVKSIHDNFLYSTMKWMVMGDFNGNLDGTEHSGYEEDPSIGSGTRDFQTIANYCEFSDLASHGPNLTWCNKRGNGLICKKLDRVLVRDGWGQIFPGSYCVFEGGGCSDHLRARINLGAELIRPKKPFKFVNILATLLNFVPRIQEFWSETREMFISTSALFFFTKKLKELNPVIKQLHRDKIRDLASRCQNALEILEKKQEEILTNPTVVGLEEVTRAEAEWTFLSGLEEGFLKQRSKLHWLGVGDQCNKVFFKVVKAREAKNSIREIECLNVVTVCTQQDIKEEAVRHFEDFLSYQTPDFVCGDVEEIEQLLEFRCSSIEKEFLICDVTEEEVKKTLFNAKT